MLIAHLSDLHLAADPAAQLWGHDPTANFAAALAGVPADVDAVVVTGDLTEDASSDSYTRVHALLGSLGRPSYAVPGNHDEPAVMARTFGELAGVRAVALSPRWLLVLVDSHWPAHEGGSITTGTLERLRDELARATGHAVVAVHHPPHSPCGNDDCRLVDADAFLAVIHDSPVRAVLSGHVHQQFDTPHDGITFLGGPSTFRQLRHGGEPHYQDTHEPPAYRLVQLDDDGTVNSRVVTVR